MANERKHDRMKVARRKSYHPFTTSQGVRGFLLVSGWLTLLGFLSVMTIFSATARQETLFQATVTLPPDIHKPKATNQTAIALEATPTPFATLVIPTATPVDLDWMQKAGLSLECKSVAPVGDPWFYRTLDCKFTAAPLPPLPPTLLERLIGFLSKQWELARPLLTALALWGAGIYIVIFWLSALWGFRERLTDIAHDPERSRAPFSHFLHILFELTLYVCGPVVYPATWIVRLLLLPVYLLGYAIVALLGIVIGIISGVFHRIWDFLQSVFRSWKREGKKLYLVIRNYDYLDRLHKRITRSVDLSAQILISQKPISRYFMEDSFLKVSTQLHRADDAIISLSTVIRDETHPLPQRKQAIESLCKLAENCENCSPDKIEAVQNTLLLLAQDAALAVAVRIHAARMLTNHARRASPRHNHNNFNDESAYHAWKALAEDRHLKPVVVRLGAINMMRMRLKYIHRAEKNLWALFLDELKNTTNPNPAFRVRAAILLQSNLLRKSKHDNQQDAAIPMRALHQYITCKGCRPEEQFLAAFGIGYLFKEREHETGPLLGRLAAAPDCVPNLRLKALAALRRFQRINTLQELATRQDWKTGQDLNIRLAAAKWLTSMDQIAALAAWQPIVADTDIDIGRRIQSAEQALEIGAAYAHQFLLQIGTHHPEAERLLAANALANCGCVEEARSILILLTHEVTHDRNIALQAFEALSKLPG